MTQVHARSTFPQLQGSLGVVRPLGASRLGAGLAHTPLKWLGEPIFPVRVELFMRELLSTSEVYLDMVSLTLSFSSPFSSFDRCLFKIDENDHYFSNSLLILPIFSLLCTTWNFAKFHTFLSVFLSLHSCCPVIRSDEALWRNVIFSIKTTFLGLRQENGGPVARFPQACVQDFVDPLGRKLPPAVCESLRCSFQIRP